MAAAAPAAAHPHVWVTVETEIDLDEAGRLAAIRERWAYDAMYSSYALFGLDRNGDGVYAQSELSELLANLDQQLRARGHFTSASVGGRSIALADATEAALKVEPDGALSLTFVKAVLQPAMIKGEDLSIEVRDVEYFVDFQFSHDRYATIRPTSRGCLASLSDGQPPAGSDPEALMKALIDGPVQTLGSSIHIRCD